MADVAPSARTAAPQALRRHWADRGVELDAHGRPRRFGAVEEENRRLLESVGLADRSHAGRLLATGPDILDLLHRLSTADLAGLRPGQGRPAVLLTPKGRIIQRISVHHGGDVGVWILTGPGGGDAVRQHLDRFTFAERTGLEDASASWAQLVLLGPAARDVAATATAREVPRDYGLRPVSLVGVEGFMIGADAWSAEGVTFLVPADAAGSVWEHLARAADEAGGGPVGDEAVETWRIRRRFPEHGSELTDQHNPLEAGLWEAVSFSKGCYVGQEVVARLRTYDKVARALCGLRLAGGASRVRAGTGLRSPEGQDAGVVTSVAGRWALAYVRRKWAEPGTRLRLGDAEAAPEVEVLGPDEATG